MVGGVGIGRGHNRARSGRNDLNLARIQLVPAKGIERDIGATMAIIRACAAVLIQHLSGGRIVVGKGGYSKTRIIG